MTATSPELDNLLRHYAGREQLQHAFFRPNWWPPGTAFAESPDQSLLWSLGESFGRKEFDAGICFIDMVGFSEKARGKTPKEVSAIVAPFLQAVIIAATQDKCYVDKTIGDEVMVVMPVFPNMEEPLNDMAWFLFHVVQRMAVTAPDAEFRAGIAFGNVVLEEIKAESYREWSVFGNCVNGAKRLQDVALPATVQRVSAYRAIFGAVDSDYPNFLQHFEAWLRRDRAIIPRYLPPLEFFDARKDCEELKGVGRMCFHDSFIRVKAGGNNFRQERS